MGIKYKPGQLNSLYTDPSASREIWTGFGSRPGEQSDISQWSFDLADRVKSGDPAALAELQTLVRADKNKVGDPKANLARKISNTYTGTKYLTPYDDSSILEDMAPGLLAMAGAAGLGLLAPALAGGAGAASAGGFGTAGMAGAGGAGILGAPSTAFLGAANAGAASAAGGGGAAAGGAGSVMGAGGVGAGGAAGGSGLLSAAGGAKGILGTIKGAAPLILGGLGAAQSASQFGQANDLRQQAIDMARQDYAGRAPLRDAFSAGALKALPQRPDLSGMLRTTNPYQNPVPR